MDKTKIRHKHLRNVIVSPEDLSDMDSSANYAFKMEALTWKI